MGWGGGGGSGRVDPPCAGFNIDYLGDVLPVHVDAGERAVDDWGLSAGWDNEHHKASVGYQAEGIQSECYRYGRSST